MLTVRDDHFEGHENLNSGQRRNGDATLDELLAELQGRVKAGSVTAAGAGTTAVAFATAFADTNYSIAFATDDATTAPEFASKAAGGFDLVVAAAGVVNWTATHY